MRTCLGRTVGVQSMGEHTAIEMIGSDRPGVLSEIFAVLTNLRCNIVAAEVWTHNARLACVVYVTDDIRLGPIEDMEKFSIMKEQLCNVLEVSEDRKRVKTDFSVGLTHTDRRLHQMMFADRDYENSPSLVSKGDRSIRPHITIEYCKEKEYSVVNVRCQDRPKLLFDTVCTLTDMQYVVFHGTIDSDGPKAIQVCTRNHFYGLFLPCFIMVMAYGGVLISPAPWCSCHVKRYLWQHFRPRVTLIIAMVRARDVGPRW